MDFSAMVESIMPLVDEGNSELQFILTRSGGRWVVVSERNWGPRSMQVEWGESAAPIDRYEPQQRSR